MSSEAIARAEAFAKKADELYEKGHVLHAAENYGHAAEAASALGEDNLVAVHMLLREGNMRFGVSGYLTPGAEDDPSVLVPHYVEHVALLSGAAAARVPTLLAPMAVILGGERVGRVAISSQTHACRLPWRQAMQRW